MPLIRRPVAATGTPPAVTGTAPNPLSALRLGSVDERWLAARALGGVPDAVGGLAQALLHEADERVRAAMFTSLAMIGTDESLDAVVGCLRSDNANLRTGALDALRLMPAAVERRLDSLLHDADPDIRLLACDLVRDIPARNATEMLSDLLDTDPSENVCAAAVDVLAEIGSPTALASLARCAQRFPGRPFLSFAVKVASERIGARVPTVDE